MSAENRKHLAMPSKPPEIMADGFSRVRARRVFEGVADAIRQMVADGQLRPGDKLPAERVLCERFGVGRATLREALRSLESAGILDLRAGKTGGAFVTAGDPKAVSSGMRDLLHLQSVSFADLTEARIRLSRIVVELAIERATEEDIAALQNNIRAAEQLYDQGRLMDKTRKNIEFHLILARATKNPILVILGQTLADLFTYFVERLGSETTRETFLSRKRFMKAFIARDTKAALAEMDRNLKKVHDLYSRLAQKE